MTALDSALHAAVPAPAPATILAEGRELSCDTRATGLNNNLLVLGPSGSGKTRHVLKPNLLQMGSSFLVLDTKGQLHREVGPVLARHGYDVQCVNFADLASGGAGAGAGDAVGYNPLAHVRRDPVTGRPNQQDVLSVSKALCPVEDTVQPFWDMAAANYLSCCVAYVLEELPSEERNLRSVVRLVEELQTGRTERLMRELEESDPESYALAIWRRTRVTQGAERMNASILGILAEKVMCLSFDSAYALYEAPRQVDFARMGHERVALFATVSDVDHSLDPLTSLFVTQAIWGLMREADRCPEGRLPMPVRLMLDDFSNLNVPDFADVISVLRSREIWCALLLQTVSQLEHRYGDAAAQTIVGNCDEQLVLAFQDVVTAAAYADRANRLPSSLLATPPDRAWLFVRGRAGEEVRRFELSDHPLYEEMMREDSQAQVQ
ncbi:MAG TPA: type IV secretory system conjugative DNA transfer family protein [Candidatus Olsenella pullistercoris]|uniref:Type IV secretory system conjugative DNA transfer family protein n=1 Tax=Candidatus Olsenella pullistercoris TaxID=2838712 RepID=A0A9D2EYH4_9ACTN|nr:type IV secretory system conjugative DNA transfer family protein [Candidatus Olsenella pullistercoris]